MFGWVLAASLVYGFGLLFVLLQNKEKRVKWFTGLTASENGSS
jgi:hypothetical protein